MKRWIVIILFIAVLSPFLIFVSYKSYYYYMPPKEHCQYAINKKISDDTLKIAFIGDSWAFLHVPYDSISSQIISCQLNRPALFSSYGGCGMTSKEVYDFPYRNHDVKRFLDKGFDYCVISAGINDTYRKVSSLYYERSMDFIIRFYLSNDITPIIIEIPDYDIEGLYYKQTNIYKLFRELSMFITGTKINCKQVFRNVLNNLVLKNNYYKQRVYIIHYKEWNSNYHEDLSNYYLPDHIHLNAKGYALLDSCIIKYIKKDLITHKK